jgi:HSP20 family protein
MTLIKYRPQSSINKFFDNNTPSLLNWFSDVSSYALDDSRPPTNIREDKDRYMIELAAPGNARTDFKVFIENDELVIALNRKEKNKNENTDKGYWIQEFRAESFEKRFHLSDNIQKEGINAKYNSGVLIVDIPKQTPADPISIKIE